MDREFGRYGSFDIFEEVDELPMGMPGTALAQDLTGLNIEGGKEREGAMAKIVVAAPLGSSRTERQKRLGAFQRLDLALFIDAEDHGVCRRTGM
jgi:hypothetical protein